MHIETETLKVVQLLLKGEDYEELCPLDEDTWYNFEEVTENDLLKRLLSAGTLHGLRTGNIDYAVCRGDW